MSKTPSWVKNDSPMLGTTVCMDLNVLSFDVTRAEDYRYVPHRTLMEVHHMRSGNVN